MHTDRYALGTSMHTSAICILVVSVCIPVCILRFRNTSMHTGRLSVHTIMHTGMHTSVICILVVSVCIPVCILNIEQQVWSNLDRMQYTHTYMGKR